MKKNRNESDARAEKLIRAIAEDKLSPELREQLKEWFISVPENGAAEKALSLWAERNIKAKTTLPDKAES